MALVGLLLPSRAAAQSDFFTVTPCRLVDTRNPVGPYGGPALTGGPPRVFIFGGQCGIPDGVGAVSINLTVTQSMGAGELRLYPDGTPVTQASTINFSAGQTRANNATVTLGTSGGVAFLSVEPGTVQVIVDVNGYYPVHTPQVYDVRLGTTRFSCGFGGTIDIWNFNPAVACSSSYPLVLCGLIHIRVGDTINWVWSGGTHSTTSGIVGFGSTPVPDGKWDSGTQTGPFTFSHTFTQTGTYPYFCSPGHAGNPTSANPCNPTIRHETGVVIVDP